MESPGSTIYCFREGDRQAGSRPIDLAEDQEDTGPAEAIRCRACGCTVTARKHMIEVNGSHAHTFFNPAGIVYELGCFSGAEGCYRTGEATGEFTWFAGYLWRFALCRNCHRHLGWFFQGGNHSFFGLILANLAE